MDISKVALITIDLQMGVINMCENHIAETTLDNSEKLLNHFNQFNSFTPLIYVPNNSDELPENWDKLHPKIYNKNENFLVPKENWGAFHNTGLHEELRKRNIDTLVLCGISTAYGVDTTSREAFQHGYNLIFAIDAMAGFTKEEHDYVKEFIFPKIGEIMTTSEIIENLNID